MIQFLLFLHRLLPFGCVADANWSLLVFGIARFGNFGLNTSGVVPDAWQ